MLNQVTDTFGLSDNNYARKIVMANKGEASYFPNADIDRDGILTLEEFNQYCEENGIGEKEKMELMQVMMSAKTVNKIADKIKNDNEKNSKEIQDDTYIYARKGDDKYDERMDENKDSKITYEEYIKYCQKHAQEKDKSDNNKVSQENDAIKAYSKTEENQGEIKVEAQA